ncbi:chaperone modulator CbpM [Taklimakanibacter lacteus]|uniref:chaperone modulator CbpM n=1 Tax=Taklimakanibacter lacteus TaxID=2268456 RepID=UPI000E65F852
MTRKTILFAARYDEETLREWVAAGWITIEESAIGEPLSEADEARCNLICDLKQNMGVNDDGIDVILHLLDQIHGLRRVLRETLDQPKRG